MTTLEIQYIIQWWTVFLCCGFLFLIPTSQIFHNFLDKGYIFSKIIGIITITYVVFVLGTLQIARFNESTIILVALSLFCLSTLLVQKLSKKSVLQLLFNGNKKTLLFFALEEFLFLLTLITWTYVRGHQPNIHGLEKYMDFGFVNSILRTTYFPSQDMWFAPYSINYYYFGHLVTATLTKISYIPSFITYNLMIATLFAFTFTGAFSLSINLLYSLLKKSELDKAPLKTYVLITAGLISGYLASLSGNLHTIYSFFKPYENSNPLPIWDLAFSPVTFPNAYWYPNATRFIYNTIHEFPLYSFVVSDLHGHVLGIPIVLTIISLLAHEFIYKKSFSLKIILLISFLIAASYMTNALDGPIYLLLTGVMLTVHFFIQKNTLSSVFKILPSLLVLLIGFLIFSAPFSFHFNSFVSGIGILCAPDFLVSMNKIGPFLFEPNHCQKSPLWQLFILYGFFWIWSLLLAIKLFKAQFRPVDFFVCVLIITAFFLTIIPEFAYFKDIYPAHYRANTMFKLGYQAFIFFSLASGYSIIRSLSGISIKTAPLYVLGYVALALVVLYPYFAVNSYYDQLKTYHAVNGTTYLQKIYPTDFAAIEWLNKNISGQPVILEAQGDSYTDFGRISVHTGLPTVLGWTVHEWLWRGSYGIPAERIPHIQTIYEDKNLTKTQELINEFNISLIFVGDLERQKYPNLNELKFEDLGTRVYHNGTTSIYKVN